jgi:hypothetical protein
MLVVGANPITIQLAIDLVRAGGTCEPAAGCYSAFRTHKSFSIHPMRRKPRQRALRTEQIALVKAHSVGLVRQPGKMDHTEETGDASMQSSSIASQFASRIRMVGVAQGQHAEARRVAFFVAR